MTKTTATAEQQREQLIHTAVDLIRSHPTGVWEADAIVRYLELRGMLTSRVQREEEVAKAISLHATFNMVPIAQVKAERARAHTYITALEQAVEALIAQIDTVSTLSGVAKTVKGQRLLANTKGAGAYVERARTAYINAEASPRSRTTA